jgi:hypothetical protein
LGMETRAHVATVRVVVERDAAESVVLEMVVAVAAAHGGALARAHPCVDLGLHVPVKRLLVVVLVVMVAVVVAVA